MKHQKQLPKRSRFRTVLPLFLLLSCKAEVPKDANQFSENQSPPEQCSQLGQLASGKTAFGAPELRLLSYCLSENAKLIQRNRGDFEGARAGRNFFSELDEFVRTISEEDLHTIASALRPLILNSQSAALLLNGVEKLWGETDFFKNVLGRLQKKDDKLTKALRALFTETTEDKEETSRDHLGEILKVLMYPGWGPLLTVTQTSLDAHPDAKEALLNFIAPKGPYDNFMRSMQGALKKPKGFWDRIGGFSRWLEKDPEPTVEMVEQRRVLARQLFEGLRFAVEKDFLAHASRLRSEGRSLLPLTNQLFTHTGDTQILIPAFIERTKSVDNIHALLQFMHTLKSVPSTYLAHVQNWLSHLGPGLRLFLEPAMDAVIGEEWLRGSWHDGIKMTLLNVAKKLPEDVTGEKLEKAWKKELSGTQVQTEIEDALLYTGMEQMGEPARENLWSMATECLTLHVNQALFSEGLRNVRAPENRRELLTELENLLSKPTNILGCAEFQPNSVEKPGLFLSAVGGRVFASLIGSSFADYRMRFFVNHIFRNEIQQFDVSETKDLHYGAFKVLLGLEPSLRHRVHDKLFNSLKLNRYLERELETSQGSEKPQFGLDIIYRDYILNYVGTPPEPEHPTSPTFFTLAEAEQTKELMLRLRMIEGFLGAHPQLGFLEHLAPWLLEGFPSKHLLPLMGALADVGALSGQDFYQASVRSLLHAVSDPSGPLVPWGDEILQLLAQADHPEGSALDWIRYMVKQTAPWLGDFLSGQHATEADSKNVHSVIAELSRSSDGRLLPALSSFDDVLFRGFIQVLLGIEMELVTKEPLQITRLIKVIRRHGRAFMNLIERWGGGGDAKSMGNILRQVNYLGNPHLTILADELAVRLDSDAAYRWLQRVGKALENVGFFDTVNSTTRLATR